MTSTLAQIAMILTVAAPLQAAPTTQPAATKADVTKLQTQIDAKTKEIIELRTSLAKIAPNGRQAVENVDKRYSRSISSLVAIFALFVAAITVLAALIGIVFPIIAGRRDRERVKRFDDWLKTAKDELDRVTDRTDGLESRLDNVEKELRDKIDAEYKVLDKKINLALNRSLAGVYELEADTRLMLNGAEPAVVFLYLLAIGNHMDANTPGLAQDTAEKLLAMEWPPDTLSPESDSAYCGWRLLDLVITAVEKDTSGEIKAETLADLKKRRAEFGPKASDNEGTYEAPEAPEAPDNDGDGDKLTTV